MTHELGIYAGPGSDHVIASRYMKSMFAESALLKIRTVGQSELRQFLEGRSAAVILFPGSYNFDQSYISPVVSAKASLHDFVSRGGKFIGICAGAFLSFEQMIYPAHLDNHPPDSFDGIGLIRRGTSGSIRIGARPNELAIKSARVLFHQGAQAEMGVCWYMGGPHLNLDHIADRKTLCSFANVSPRESVIRRDSSVAAAIVQRPEGGQLFLSSVHPEYDPASAERKIRSILATKKPSSEKQCLAETLGKELSLFRLGWSNLNEHLSNELKRFVLS